jgi:hypothetical protein
MGVSCQHYAPATLYSRGKESPVPIGQGLEENSSDSVGDRTPVIQSVASHKTDFFSSFISLFPFFLFLFPYRFNYLQDNTTQNDEDKHPYPKRDSNPRSQQPSGQDPRLRPRGYCDWRLSYCDWRLSYCDRRLSYPGCRVKSGKVEYSDFVTSGIWQNVHYFYFRNQPPKLSSVLVR